MTRRHKKKKNKSSLRWLLWAVTIGGLCLAVFQYREELSTFDLGRRFGQARARVLGLQDSVTRAPVQSELYFGDEGSDMLMREFRAVSSSARPEKRAAALIDELIKGPAAKGMRTVPMQAKLRSVNMQSDARIDIDFGPEISQFHPGGSTAELLTVMSIVNTITANIKEVKSVRLLINGRPVDTLSGHIDCRQAFVPNMQIVR